MRTTLDLPDPLFKEVKTRAVQKGVTLKELLATYIEAGLRSPPPIEKDASQPKTHPHLPVAIPRVPGTPLHPAMTNAQLHAIIEKEDTAQYQRVIAQSSKPE